MLSDSAKVEDVPAVELMRAVKQIVPAGIEVQLYVQAFNDVKGRVTYELWGQFDNKPLARITTVGQLLAAARRESDRIQSQRLRNELDSKAAAEIAGMA